MSNDVLRRLDEEASAHLDDIKKLFVPGVKVTLLVRFPSHPDGSYDYSMSDDTLEEAIAALERRRTDPKGITIPADYECPNCGARGRKPPHAASCPLDNPYLADDPPTCCGLPAGQHSTDCPYFGEDPADVPKV